MLKANTLVTTRNPSRRISGTMTREKQITIEKGQRQKVWQGCGQDVSEREATQKKRHAEIRQRRKRRNGKEPQTGHCHWAFRSSEERREGSQESCVMG